jgi:hypothetical protein
VRSAWAPFPALILEGVTIWVTVACAQTLILKRQWPRMKWWEWIAANGAGAAVGSWPILIYASNPPFLLHVAASACMGGSCVGFIGGFILGAAQWVVLSGQEHNVGMWGWVSPVSISAGAMVGLLVAWQYLPEVFTLGTVLPVLSTVVAIFAMNGIMTGFALVTMLRSR